MTPTSSWASAEPPPGATGDWFFDLPMDEQRAIVAQNDADLYGADVVLLMGDSRGKESYAEVARALIRGTPVVWTGYRTTSVIRDGVAYASNDAEAISLLETMNRVARDASGEWKRKTCWDLLVRGAELS